MMWYLKFDCMKTQSLSFSTNLQSSTHVLVYLKTLRNEIVFTGFSHIESTGRIKNKGTDTFLAFLLLIS